MRYILMGRSGAVFIVVVVVVVDVVVVVVVVVVSIITFLRCFPNFQRLS